MRSHEDSKVATEFGLINNFSHSASRTKSNKNREYYHTASVNRISLYKAKQIVRWICKMKYQQFDQSLSYILSSCCSWSNMEMSSHRMNSIFHHFLTFLSANFRALLHEWDLIKKGVRENTVTHTQKSKKSSLSLRNDVSIWEKHATWAHSYIHHLSQQNYRRIRSLNHEN